MFSFLDLVTKRVNDQMIEYAAVQSDIARRLWSNWLDPFHACQPVKVRSDRHERGGTSTRDTAPRLIASDWPPVQRLAIFQKGGLFF